MNGDGICSLLIEMYECDISLVGDFALHFLWMLQPLNVECRIQHPENFICHFILFKKVGFSFFRLESVEGIVVCPKTVSSAAAPTISIHTWMNG